MAKKKPRTCVTILADASSIGHIKGSVIARGIHGYLEDGTGLGYNWMLMQDESCQHFECLVCCNGNPHLTMAFLPHCLHWRLIRSSLSEQYGVT